MTPEAARFRHLGGAKRLVVKLGSSLIAPEDAGVRRERVRALAEQVAALRREGREVLLVSSGAIASGMRVLGLKRRPDDISAKQALAAVGQPELMRAYAEAFGAFKLTVAQVLLTQDDIQDRSRYLNARNALKALAARGVVPVVNENDIVAVDEIRMGENDLLSALVTLLVEADALVILTDVDGLHDGPPGRAGARRLDFVAAVTPEIKRLAAHGAGSEVGTGGMATKLRAAEIATRAGHAVLVARGTDARVLARAAAGEPVGTFFMPAAARMPARKGWLAFGVRARGTVQVDAGARAALVARGTSLLPKGVTRISGTFDRGMVVALVDEHGGEIGKGVVSYSSAELARIKGHAAREIEGLLGHSHGDEVVHRDDLVVITNV